MTVVERFQQGYNEATFARGEWRKHLVADVDDVDDDDDLDNNEDDNYNFN